MDTWCMLFADNIFDNIILVDEIKEIVNAKLEDLWRHKLNHGDLS